MAVVQIPIKDVEMRTRLDLVNIFVGMISGMMKNYSEKIMHNIKPVKLALSHSTNIKLVSLKTLLSHIETKEQLTEYFGGAFQREFADSDKDLVVIYGTSTYANQTGHFDEAITLTKKLIH